MKRLLFVAFLATLSACSSAQVKVGADKSFTVSMKNYKTYGWSQKIDQIPGDDIFVGVNGVLVFNNESTRSKIKDAIKFEMDAKGYKFNESQSDMFLIFYVTEKPGHLTTFNGYQMFNDGFDSTRSPKNVRHTKIAAGTLIINVIDSKSGKVAWQGYASGILKPAMVNSKSKVRQAVADIFAHFHNQAKS